MRLCRPGLLLTAFSLGAVTSAQAQSRPYLGGSVAFATSTQSGTVDRVGGTTWSGAIVVGTPLSGHVSLEFDATFDGDLSAETYTYRPSLDQVVTVEAEGRDRFFSVQLRGHAGVLEPVAGVSYVRSGTHRHASFVPAGRTYFDDEQSQNAIAFTGGLDAAFGLSPRLAIVPTFRVFVVARPDRSLDNPVTGSAVVVRAGVGARVSF